MSAIRLSDAISEYLSYASSNYAHATVRAFRSSLGAFLTEVGNIWMKNVNSRHVDMFTDSRLVVGISPTTLRNNLSHLRVFLAWSRQRKYFPVNSDPIGRRRIRRVIPRTWVRIPVDEFPRLLDSAANARDRAIIAFGLYTLCRQSEVAEARIGDLDLENGWLEMRVVKSGLTDQMPICAELSVELHRWLQIYEQAAGGLDPTWKLFPVLEPLSNERGKDGRLMAAPEGKMRLIVDRSPSRIHHAVHRALKRCGYGTEREGVHTLRRSAARARFDQLVEDGYDGALRQVQALLHHERSSTTEHYLGLTIEVQKRNDAIRGQRMFGSSEGKSLRVVSA